MLVNVGLASSDKWLMIATLHLVYLCSILVMRDKALARSMLDFICGVIYLREKADICRLLSSQ